MDTSSLSEESRKEMLLRLQSIQSGIEIIKDRISKESPDEAKKLEEQLKILNRAQVDLENFER